MTTPTELMRLIIKHISLRWTKSNTGTPEYEIHRVLGREVPPHLMNHFLNELTLSKWISYDGTSPDRIFYPRSLGSRIQMAPCHYILEAQIRRNYH